MRPEALHLTLCFLGPVAEDRIAGVAEAVRSIPARPVAVALDPQPSPLPKGRPALYAVEARSPVAIAIQAELSEALAALRVYEPEQRSFWPHLTVARVRSERRPPERGQRRGKSRPRRVSEAAGPAPRRRSPSPSKPSGSLSTVRRPSRRAPSTSRLDGVDLPPA